MSHPNHCGALAALVLMFVLSPRAEAERIRTAVPGSEFELLVDFFRGCERLFQGRRIGK